MFVICNKILTCGQSKVSVYIYSLEIENMETGLKDVHAGTANYGIFRVFER